MKTKYFLPLCRYFVIPKLRQKHPKCDFSSFNFENLATFDSISILIDGKRNAQRRRHDYYVDYNGK